MKLNSHGTVIVVSTIKSMSEVIRLLSEKKIPYGHIGAGSNLVFCKDKYQKVFIKTNFDYRSLISEEIGQSLKLYANTPLSMLTKLAMEKGLSNWKVFTGVPATLGGAVFMNAGTSLGEIGSLVKKVTIIDESGHIQERSTNASDFSYRKNHFLNKNEIIVEVELDTSSSADPEIVKTEIKEYQKKRQLTQPLNYPNCGCVFKNPSRDNPAGKIIDELGLKGLRQGDLSVSEKHANFIINQGEASGSDFLKIVERIREIVLEKKGILLETEIQMEYGP
jgi:UDP-N-acetylmuramate dehydrogenase